MHDIKVYLIDSIFYNGIIFCNKILYPYFVVDELIKKGIEVRCLRYINYTEYINGDSVSEFVEYVYKAVSSLDATTIINSFSGLFNGKYKSNNIKFLTKEHKIAVNAQFENFEVEWDGPIENR